MGAFAQGGTTIVPELFINLDIYKGLFLIALGFFGGMLSGFIGSGGAFVLTPGMMSIGVQGPIAVASNMCHKFPKAMIEAQASRLKTCWLNGYFRHCWCSGWYSGPETHS